MFKKIIKFLDGILCFIAEWMNVILAIAVIAVYVNHAIKTDFSLFDMIDNGFNMLERAIDSSNDTVYVIQVKGNIATERKIIFKGDWK